MEEQLASITKTLNEIKSTQNKLIQSFNDQNKTIKNFNNRFDDLLNQIKKITDENILLNNKVSQLELKIKNFEQNTTSTSNTTHFDIINEIADRQSRINNIILFNLPEPTETKPDSDQIKLILDEMELKIQPVRYFRLGNPSSRTRPLKITFNDTKNVFDILRAQSKIRSSNQFKEIRFSSDRTMKQREQMSKLRQELESRRNNGEQNIIIKYIKGNPTIINNPKN
ncbi:uncharacterized protein LOC126905115 [Daktulosphaira vitifoliae]|uniref:uncharacterized protein LOC126905115 n=1 Tax=Daktulosphaira vitifoliae TaxID=58002 RepID=UPI0021AAA14C|nr:uncharacterized protein LOC126905115 [Daktulosphaira vitifoliae]